MRSWESCLVIDMRFKKIWISLFISIMLVGCTDTQIIDLIAYVQLWAIANDYTTSDGELDGNRLMIMLLSGGNIDPGQSAILNQTKNVEKIKIANDLAKEGFNDSDPEKLEEAMRQRPQEYGFQAQHAVVIYTDSSNFHDIINETEEQGKKSISAEAFVEMAGNQHLLDYPIDLIEAMDKNASKQSPEDRVRAQHAVINSAAFKLKQFEEVLEPIDKNGNVAIIRNYISYLEEQVRYSYTVYQSWLSIAKITQSSTDKEQEDRARQIYMNEYAFLKSKLRFYHTMLIE